LKQAIHLVWEHSTGIFKGINTFGIRMRHELFDTWLRKKASVDEVLSNLRAANFDPEFYALHEPEIVATFNQVSGKNVQLKQKTWWRNLLKA
jgi:hypothetical protein